MDNYLIDRETLGMFVDELIKKKPLPVNDPAELSNLREATIKQLDDTISRSIFTGLTQDQCTELNQLLDNPATTEADYDAFFTDHNINLEQNITTAIEQFGREFLGGPNA